MTTLGKRVSVYWMSEFARVSFSGSSHEDFIGEMVIPVQGFYNI